MSETALVERQPEHLVPQGLFATSDPVAVIEHATRVANALKSVLVEKGLIANIKQREYPTVEAWTLLGSMLGVFPSIEWTRPCEQGWEARCVAVTKHGEVVGAGEAMCTRKEQTWRQRDDYALRGMAQTRAVSRALRLPLGFVMKLAGYEPTGAEDMPPPEEEGARASQRKRNYKPVHDPQPNVKEDRFAKPAELLNPDELPPADEVVTEIMDLALAIKRQQLEAKQPEGAPPVSNLSVEFEARDALERLARRNFGHGFAGTDEQERKQMLEMLRKVKQQ
jgi:hypothetical protein